jgi:hypothetical protein
LAETVKQSDGKFNFFRCRIDRLVGIADLIFFKQTDAEVASQDTGKTLLGFTHQVKFDKSSKFTNLATPIQNTQYSWGQCYYHYFPRFSQIYGEKMAFLLKTYVMITFSH